MSAAAAGLSCARTLETAVRQAVQRARPSLVLPALSSAGGAKSGVKDGKKKEKTGAMPPLLGVRRSAQKDADYQTSIALALANGALRGDKTSPARLAQDIVDAMETGNPAGLLRDAFVSSNGFVNLVLDDAFLARHAVRMATEGVTPTRPEQNPDSRAILVDFAAPNLGKKLHVGHLRSSVIGDTLCNLLEFRGHRVARVSHTGDVGSALATLVVELMERGLPLETLSDAQLGACYESGKRKLAQGDAAFKSKVDATVIQMQHLGDSSDDTRIDPRVRETWTRACEVSRDAYAKTFSRLRVNVEERGESTYLPLVADVVGKLKNGGLAVESRGALGIFVDGPDKPPMLVQKSDGGFLYATIDLACLYSRIHGFPGVDATQYDEIVYVTDQSQQLHFRHLFAAAEMAGWTARDGASKVKLTHAPFGLVLGKDGAKLSSRNGAFDYLDDLLDGAAAECTRRSLASATSAGLSVDMTDSEREQQNGAIGDAAVRYFELAQQRERNYKFAFDQVLNLRGNTGVYLMYASARLQGILRKASSPSLRDWSDLLATAGVDDELVHASADWHPSERALALLLSQFDDEVAATLAHLYPHYLCDYLFRVAGQFHVFYESCRVLGDARQDSRLVLCAATDSVLRRGLQLVGMRAVQRM
jgi:arginyl-tRNA synthetase